MNFEPSEDRRMLADTLNRFIAEQYDFPTRAKIAASAAGFSPELWQRFADLGIVAALFSEDDGGLGGSGFDLAVVFEALGRGLVLEPFLNALLVGRAISKLGDTAQRALLDAIIGGATLPAFAHEEADAHYALAHVASRAERSGDGWVLNGVKVAVQLGEHADLFLVSARSAGQVGDTDGISLFLVPASSAGLSVQGRPNIDGGRSVHLSLHDVRLDQSALLGEAEAGYAVLEEIVGAGILALCAEALGAMEVAKTATLDYLQTRKQFGSVIGSFQALQHRMASMLIEIEQVRSAVINAAAALEGERLPRELALSAAKHTVGRSGALVSEESIQLHGAIGMTWELPLAHYAKRLVMIDHQFGDEDHHLARYIALGKQ